MNATILTASGQHFDLQHPEASPINILTIAHALSHLCRFTGHCREFYSVAQHSLMVSFLVDPQHALAGLLHDAAEAYVGDVSAPLKQLLPDYQAVERQVEAAVLQHFGLAPELPGCVKAADLVMLATEQRDLMSHAHRAEVWTSLRGVDPLLDTLVPMHPVVARRAFLERFAQLSMRP